MDTYVISVGGSIFSKSDDILFDFLKARELRDLLSKYVEQGNKFILCIGGGYVTRKYQAMLKNEGMADIELDNVGIACINLNATLLKSVFGNLASDKILRYDDYLSEDLIEFNDKSIVIAAGGFPGHSSDWNTVKLALRSNSKNVINLSNTKGLYTSDPRNNPDAKFISKTNWSEYFEIIGNPTEFVPGAHYPVDVLASKLSNENNINFILLDGRELITLDKYLSSAEIDGTLISNE